MFEAERLKKLHEFATKGDLSTAERHVAEEHIECPVCQGDGEVLASDYCNIDGKALGVQFYGIGNEFGAHEALWTYLVHSVPAILALAEREKRMREAFQDFSDALENSDFANAAHELNSQMCCTGYACGCRGSTVGEYLAHELRETARRALGEEKAS